MASTSAGRAGGAIAFAGNSRHQPGQAQPRREVPSPKASQAQTLNRKSSP